MNLHDGYEVSVDIEKGDIYVAVTLGLASMSNSISAGEARQIAAALIKAAEIKEAQ